MTASAHLHDTQELYRHWEHEQWNPWSIDLTVDRGQWHRARHMQFYALFQNEVIDDPATIATHVARSRNQLGDSFAVIFDQALVSAHEHLAANPADPFAKVDFVTIYHLIIESTLGPTAFEFITRYLTTSELLPGFVDGYSHVHHDEQRHIGYGVWYLRHAAQRDPALAEQIRTGCDVLWR